MEILSKPILLQIVGIFACKYFHNFFFLFDENELFGKNALYVCFRITSGCKGYIWTTEKWPKETARGCWLKNQFQFETSNEEIVFGNVFNVISNRN